VKYSSPKFNLNYETILLGFWEARGQAQVIRLVLEHLGVKYEERVYKDKN
jgi:hypothetical protein